MCIRDRYVDFNEMLEENLVMLSQNDFTNDSAGNEIKLFDGLEVKIYMKDYNEFNERDDLFAEGKVESCLLYTSRCV